MFRKNLSRFKKTILPLLGVLGVVVFMGMIFPAETEAANILGIPDISQAIIGVIGKIGGMILGLLGTLLGILIEQLIGIFSFNNFVNLKAPPAVHIGWSIVRDLSNMMFIVALMVISFGTILKIQSYHARSLLIKMIIMAILINFSKTITGMFVDFAQVIMLTFVDAFKDSAAIVLTVGMNLAQMTSFGQETDGLSGFMSVIAAIFLANAMLVVAIAVIIAMLIIIVARILMIWILVILSPIAYIASILPNTTKYASQWWQALGKNLISGPILAFFLWLSLSIISTSAGMPIDLSSEEIDAGGGDLAGSIDAGSGTVPKGATDIMSTQNMFNYIITIALMITGIMLTQQLGVMGGGAVGKIPGMLQKMGMGAIKQPFKRGSQAWAWGSRKVKARTGLEFNPANIVRTMKAGYQRKREQEEGVGMVKAGERLEKGGAAGAIQGLGAASWVDNYAQGFLYRKGFQKLRKGRGGKITDMRAEKKRRQDEVERLKELRDQQNSSEAYKSAHAGEMADANQEMGAINIQIENLRAEGNFEAEAVQLETEASGIEERILSGDIPLADAGSAREQIDGKRAEAAALRERGEGFDTEDMESQIEELEAHRQTIQDDRVAPLEAQLAEYNGLHVEGDPESYKKQHEYAQARLSEMADRRSEARQALLDGGLTEDQIDARNVKIDNINLEIDKVETDITNKASLGQDAEIQRKMLRALQDKKKSKEEDPETGEYKATEQERKDNQAEIERLEKEAKIFSDASKRDYISQGDRDKFAGQIAVEKKGVQDIDGKIKEESSYRPIDFLANLERRRINDEAARKYNTTNEDELMAHLQNAKTRGNVTDAAAVAMQSARVGHLNELVLDHRAEKDWWEDTDGVISDVEKAGSKLVFGVGDSLTAGIEGLHVYMNEVFEKGFGYSRQATLALENDLSGAAEGVNHWTMGQAVTTTEDGQFVQRTRAEQGARAFTERSKREVEGLYRTGNRLSIGTESWVDDDDHSKGRKAILNEYAVREMQNWEALDQLAQRKRINSSAAMHIMKHNRPLMENMGRQAEVDGKGIKYRDFMANMEVLAAGEGPAGAASDDAPQRGDQKDLGEARELMERLGLK
jgi:hypothetical protein